MCPKCKGTKEPTTSGGYSVLSECLMWDRVVMEMIAYFCLDGINHHGVNQRRCAAKARFKIHNFVKSLRHLSDSDGACCYYEVHLETRIISFIFAFFRSIACDAI